jgi:hypothetical protein
MRPRSKPREKPVVERVTLSPVNPLKPTHDVRLFHDSTPQALEN